MGVGARTREGIVARDLHQTGKKRVTRSARSAGKLGERVLTGWARCELSATHDQRAK
jgi:hypothetical protein